MCLNDALTKVIKRVSGFETLEEEPTYGRLSADEYRDFWISWYQGQLEVGEGAIPGEQVRVFTYELHPFVDGSLISRLFSIEIPWKLVQHAHYCKSFVLPNLEPTQRGMEVLRRHRFRDIIPPLPF